MSRRATRARSPQRPVAMPRPNSNNGQLAIGLGLGIALFAAAPIGFLLYGKVRRGAGARARRRRLQPPHAEGAPHALD